MKRWRSLLPLGIDHHAHGEAAAILARASASRGRWRAPPAAWARRGRENRPSCRANRRCGPAHRPGARNGPTSAMATQRTKPPGFLRIAVGLGEDRIVEIAGILAVDGDQRHRAQIGALARGRRAGPPAASAWPRHRSRRGCHARRSRAGSPSAGRHGGPGAPPPAPGAARGACRAGPGQARSRPAWRPRHPPRPRDIRCGICGPRAGCVPCRRTARS